MEFKQLETREEAFCMANMAAGSRAQNHQLVTEIEEGLLDYQTMYILKDDSTVCARAQVIEEQYLAYLTFEDIPQQDANFFIHQLLQRYSHFNLMTHLYSDKRNHATTYASLEANGFVVTQRKISHITKPRPSTTSLEIKTFTEDDKALVLELIEDVGNHTLDRDIALDINEKGHKEAAKAIYQWFQDASVCLLGYQNGYCVGFVVAGGSYASKSVGIKYIGVVEKYRGNGYGKELLKALLNECYKHDYMEIIADTDVENILMIQALQEVGFFISCTEVVFRKPTE